MKILAEFEFRLLPHQPSEGFGKVAVAKIKLSIFAEFSAKGGGGTPHP